ncbi:MAG: hypothetical protein ACM3ML_11285 [Micromonosporaceae bacterium]
MLPYAAYLRIYEPLTAFPEPERSHWASYAASGGVRAAGGAGVPPGKAGIPPGQHVQCHGHLGLLEAEHSEALRRIIAVPPIVAPPHESGHAYVRQADETTYICPWQTRLRSWLALGRLRAMLSPALADTFVPRRVADLTAADFARWHARGPSIRTHILTATWHVPLAWFVPFGPPERWLVLGTGSRGDAGQAPQPSGPAPARALNYATTKAQARKRVARAANAVGRPMDGGSHPYSRDNMRSSGAVGGGPGARGDGGTGRGRHAAELLSARLSAAATEIEEVGRWLEEFHPRALVELDYGGLVRLFGDEALRCDQSVAEVAAAVTGLENGELELALAMYQRLRARWRPMQATESAS